MHSDLKPLEFQAIQRVLQRLTATPYGRDAAAALEPAPSHAVAQRMQNAVSAAVARTEAQRPLKLDGLPDIRAALRQAAAPGAALAPTALFNIKCTLTAADALRPELRETPALYPGSCDDLAPPPELLDALGRTVQGAGSLRPDASAELARLAGARDGLRADVERIILQRAKDKDLAGVVVEPDKVAWNGERAVLALRADGAGKVKGVRRGTAMGGRDVLIEPLEAVQLNNRLETVVGQVTAEQQRVLREVTAEVARFGDALQRLVDALTWLDLAQAGGEMSRQLNAHAPRLSEEPEVRLDRAYHPLLLLQFGEKQGPRPVPLTLELDRERRLVLITGPNAGGKTVAMKTVGLLTAMARCGLHIPAEGDCVIGRYDRLIVDIGDHQSLFHHLSTFAGHVEMLKRVLDQTSGDSLVLLDELGTGTDPEEGAALAMAMLDELLQRPIQGIVNTHLAPLKEYAVDRAGISNASMRFDHDRLAPTFELQIGVPGRSLGLIVAEARGLPSPIVARARDHLARIQAASGGDEPQRS